MTQVADIWEVVDPYLAAERLELDDLEMTGQGKGRILRVIVDGEDVNIDRLAEDHLHASRLADGLAGLDVDGLDVVACNTNMVFVDLSDDLVERLPSALMERGVQIASRTSRVRLVTHLDVGSEDVGRIVSAFGDACSG